MRANLATDDRELPRPAYRENSRRARPSGSSPPSLGRPRFGFDRLEAATSLADLAALPGNRLEALKGDRAGVPVTVRFNSSLDPFDRPWLRLTSDRRDIPQLSRVEEGRGGLRHGQLLRFPPPLIKPPITSILTHFASTSEVRGLCSAGVTRPQRSYAPVRLPPGPPPESDGGDATSNRTGLPRLPVLPFQRAVPTTPADRTGACVDGLPVRAAFPKCTVGRRPHWFFRGLLRLHSRYGPPDRSTARGGLCHEASARPVTQPNRSSATGLIDIYPGGTSLH